MTKLIIVRHGNTFGPNEQPRRVGGRTNIPLVQSGIEQAKRLGQHFKSLSIFPDLVITSELKRTQETAEYILGELRIERRIHQKSMFNEIDYGPDENRQEVDVIQRIGQEAIEKWDRQAIVPDGWDFSPEKTTKNWIQFAGDITRMHINKTLMVVTSNGIARFAPAITNKYEDFIKNHNIKLKTGAYGILEYDEKKWCVREWGTRPS